MPRISRTSTTSGSSSFWRASIGQHISEPYLRLEGDGRFVTRHKSLFMPLLQFACMSYLGLFSAACVLSEHLVLVISIHCFLYRRLGGRSALQSLGHGVVSRCQVSCCCLRRGRAACPIETQALLQSVGGWQAVAQMQPGQGEGSSFGWMRI